METAHITGCPRRRPGVLAHPLDEDLVLYHTGSHEGFLLNNTATRIWDLANGRRKPEVIARALVRTYGIEYQEALVDVEELVTELGNRGLLIIDEKLDG